MFEHSIHSNRLMLDSANVLGEGASKPETHQLDTISNQERRHRVLGGDGPVWAGVRV